MKRNFLILISAIGLLLPGCRNSEGDYRVDFVDRRAVFALDKKPNPLRLVVELDENGKLSLNKIGTGTIDDVTDLSERIKAIFDDRRKLGIDEREVVIDPQGKAQSEQLEKLAKSLAKVKASPILVIKDAF